MYKVYLELECTGMSAVPATIRVIFRIDNGDAVELQVRIESRTGNNTVRWVGEASELGQRLRRALDTVNDERRTCLILDQATCRQIMFNCTERHPPAAVTGKQHLDLPLDVVSLLLAATPR